MPLQLGHFYGGKAEQHSFYRMQKVLLTDQCYFS